MSSRPLAVIREAECIGCTKCIEACPVDAILGSAGKMHTVIADECIGCKLCLPPCPIDCIDLLLPTHPSNAASPETRKQKAAQIRKRYTARQKRLQNHKEQQYPSMASLLSTDFVAEGDSRKTYIQNAVARTKLKKALRTKR